RLRIGRRNFRLPYDIQSKEFTLQVVYDVLQNSPIFRAFQVTADVLEIYMQEFWATAKLYHTSIHFKLDTKKSILDLEAFREMLHISPRIPNQSFAELPTEEEIMEFLRYLGHSHEIRYLTDTTQQYGAILPIELTTNEIRNSKAYKEYYACATGKAAPKQKASARKKKGDSASSTIPPTPTPTTTVASAPWLSATAKGKQPARATTLTEPTDVERTEAEQLKIVLKRSRQETHISQQCGFGTDEGTGSKPGVPDVPSDDSEEELSWNSSDDEDVGGHEEGNKSDEKSEKESNDEEDQDLRLSEDARIQEEEDAHELDVGVESIFTTASSPIVSLQSQTRIMTPSTIVTITTSGEAPIPSTTIPSIILENLPTFNSVFCFDERLRSLETSFSEYRQTNPFADAVSAILGIVHQYMTQQMKEAIREAVQIQT
nr:hypothetical protein [Tanacetum cinerariifolium]